MPVQAPTEDAVKKLLEQLKASEQVANQTEQAVKDASRKLVAIMATA